MLFDSLLVTRSGRDPSFWKIGTKVTLQLGRGVHVLPVSGHASYIFRQIWDDGNSQPVIMLLTEPVRVLVKPDAQSMC